MPSATATGEASLGPQQLGRVGSAGLGQPGQQRQGTLVGVEDGREQEVLAALEVAVQGPLRDPGPGGHLLHPRRFDAVLLADLVGRVEDPRALVVRAGRHGDSRVSGARILTGQYSIDSRGEVKTRIPSPRLAPEPPKKEGDAIPTGEEMVTEGLLKGRWPADGSEKRSEKDPIWRWA